MARTSAAARARPPFRSSSRQSSVVPRRTLVRSTSRCSSLSSFHVDVDERPAGEGRGCSEDPQQCAGHLPGHGRGGSRKRLLWLWFCCPRAEKGKEKPDARTTSMALLEDSHGDCMLWPRDFTRLDVARVFSLEALITV